MAKAFGVEQQVEVAFPQGQGSNLPIPVSSSTAVGELFKGLGDFARDFAEIARDRAMGDDVAKIREKVQEKVALGNLIEAKLETDRLKNVFLRKHGAKAFNLLDRALEVGDLTTTIDAEGRKVIVDARGNVRGRSEPTTLLQMQADEFADDVATVATNLPMTSRIAEGVINSITELEKRTPGGGRIFDGPRIQNMTMELATLPDDISRITRKHLNDTASFGSLSEKQELEARNKRELKNLIFSKMDVFDSPFLRNALRNSNGVITHQIMAELPRAFVNDVLNQMQEQRVFDILGLDRKEFENELDIKADGLAKFYEGIVKSELTEDTVNLQKLKIHNEMVQEGELKEALKDPELRRLMSVGTKLQAASQTLATADQLTFQGKSAGARRVSKSLLEHILGYKRDIQTQNLISRYDELISSGQATVTDAQTYLQLQRDLTTNSGSDEVNIFHITQVLSDVKNNEQALLKAGIPAQDLKRYINELERRQRKAQDTMKQTGTTDEDIEETKGWFRSIIDLFDNKIPPRARPAPGQQG